MFYRKSRQRDKEGAIHISIRPQHTAGVLELLGLAQMLSSNPVALADQLYVCGTPEFYSRLVIGLRLDQPTWNRRRVDN